MVDFWQMVPRFFRKDLPKHGSRLRVLPTEESYHVPGWEIIRPNTPLHVKSWRPTDGFIQVGIIVGWDELTQPVGWIRAQHLRCPVLAFGELVPDRVWTMLDNNLWFGGPWQFLIGQFSIRVDDAPPIDEDTWLRSKDCFTAPGKFNGHMAPDTFPDQETFLHKFGDFLQIAVASRPGVTFDDYIAQYLREKGHTYVALELGGATRLVTNIVVDCDHHASLGILAPMSSLERRKLQGRLDDFIRLWASTPICDRPGLVSYPRFEMRPYDDPRHGDIEHVELVGARDNFTKDDINAMLQSGQISLTASRAAELAELDDPDDKVRKLVDRDTKRHRAHFERAAALEATGLTSPPTMVIVGDPSTGALAKTSPMLADLLHYLTEILRHYHPAYTYDAKGKLVTPRVSWPSQWHVSRSGDWCTAPGVIDGKPPTLAHTRPLQDPPTIEC